MAGSLYRVEGLPRIRAGVAQTVITPPVGASLAGYFHDRISTSVRDDLHCKVVVFESGGTPLALVSCDLISMAKDQMDRIKAAIEAETGLPPANVLLCTTHTHTGPETRDNRVVGVQQEWRDALAGKVAAAVKGALDNMFDAVLFPGRREEAELGSNRLGRKKDGSEIFGKQDVVGPAGPIDPELLAIGIRDPDGNLRAMVVNYAMHPDVIGGGSANFISADWPGEIGRAVAGVYGGQPVTLFMNGTCGDINHHLWRATRHPTRGPAKAVQMGRMVAGLAINATERAEPLETGKCRALLRILQIPYYTRDAAMRAEVEELRKREKLGDFERYIVNAFDEWPHDGKLADVPVQAMRLGDVAFVGLPGEIFVRIGLDIKHWSPAKYTFIGELANGWEGYVPSSDQAHRGAYGGKPILSRRLEADAGRKMADAVQVMLCELWGE
ncbi:MAG: hypothetical protein A3K18_31920 [Lentisphaerae bacterium RIFOXYA12_64_32]|nr:MAG: hypothetical protein A3K18_31920 [Lentisphaerae bacterium RIFOXYA12_64_32]